jgi:hypothetical protein
LIEGNLVSPYIMQRQVDLPPVLTIVFVLIVGKLLGPLGLLVAVPGLAVIMVVVKRILLSRIYEGQGFRRTRVNARWCCGCLRPRAASSSPEPVTSSPSSSVAPRQIPA